MDAERIIRSRRFAYVPAQPKNFTFERDKDQPDCYGIEM